MRASPAAITLWLIAALLALLVWLTVTGRLGRSRHGYAAEGTSRIIAAATAA